MQTLNLRTLTGNYRWISLSYDIIYPIWDIEHFQLRNFVSTNSKDMNRETTVLEFFPALEAGYEPKNYSYYKEDVPLGNYKAKLDFMLWSKTYMAVNCFFTINGSLKKISLSVYKKPGEDGLYLAGDTEIRFVPFGSTMQLSVEANQNGKPILVDAVVEGNVAGD